MIMVIDSTLQLEPRANRRQGGDIYLTDSNKQPIIWLSYVLINVFSKS